VDYTKGSTPGAKQLEPVNTLFCDNIIVFCPIPDETVKDILHEKETTKEAAKEDTEEDTEDTEDTEEETEEETKLTRKVQTIVGKTLLASFTEKVKMAFNTWTDIKVNKTNIKPIKVKDLSIWNYAYEGSRFIQILKVSLANASYEAVIKFICNPKIIELFKKYDIYIHDIDFTRDYKGVFN